MCLCIPSEICELDAKGQRAIVDTLGVKRDISTHLIAEPLTIGDYLLIHVGFAISKLSPSEAMESLNEYQAMLSNMSERDAEALFH